MAEVHALSRNMKHDNISITDQIYIHVDEVERGQIPSRIHQNSVGEFDSGFSTLIPRFGKDDLPAGIQVLAKRLSSL